MDRLSTVVLCLLLLMGSACDGAGASGETMRRRVDAVAAKPQKVESPAEFCDVHHSRGGAPGFTYPQLVVDVPEVHRWKWINVWATWCEPCVAEIPLLQQWRRTLSDKGIRYDLHYLSVDTSGEEVDKFLRKNSLVKSSLRIAREDELAGWLKTIGLDASAAIPIHIFVDATQKIRCVRTGALSERSLAAIERIFRD